MKTIHVLPDHIIARIAAGEVIERPVYAVKELIENAIDASSTAITIHIEDAGLTNITVIDDGEGMSKEDLGESIKPHTTSKITENTFSIVRTLGFRGEALASIASVSDLSISSRKKNASSGFSLNAATNELKPIGMPMGTRVSVSNLFNSIPARKKFLKSTRTEFSHIIDLITNYALSYPAIHFKLTNNKKVIFDLPSTTLMQRIEYLLGKQLVTNLIPLFFEDSYISVSGFTTKPHLTTTSTTKHHIFVNNRVISDTLISHAIKDAYGTLLDNTSYPVAIIFLTIAPEMIDVNIHPRKEHIAFVQKNDILTALSSAVTKTLLDHNLTFANISWQRDFEESGKKGNLNSTAATLLKESVTPWNVKNRITENDIFQLDKTYLVTKNGTDLLLFDQHAAHERILFEAYEDEYQRLKKIGDTLTLPRGILLDLSVTDVHIVEEYISLFESLGITLEGFGNNKFVVSKIPKLLEGRNIENIILEMVDDIRDGKNIKSIDSKTKRMISYLACRGAIMAGDEISPEEAHNLIQRLYTCKQPFTCPHGRPTTVEINQKKLRTFFKRT